MNQRPAPSADPRDQLGPADWYDVVVIGAGPSGAVAARGLALRGRSVLLVEKQRFPRPKVCGCCLNRSALATLDAVGLGHVIAEQHAVPLATMTLASGSGRATFDFNGGVALSRTALDGALVHEAIRQGVVFRDGVSARVTALGRDASMGHTVTLGESETVRVSVVIVADGLGGTALADVPGFAVHVRQASRVGFGGIIPPPPEVEVPPPEGASRHMHFSHPHGHLWMICGAHGYVGAVRLEDGSLDIAAAVDRDTLKQLGGAANTVRSILQASHMDSQDIDVDAVERWRITPPLTRSRSTLAAPGVFIIGDAAGYVEPFTGEGMAWALSGGAAVVDIAHEAVNAWHTDQSTRWEAMHRQRVRSQQWGCRTLAALLRRPTMMRVAVALLSWCPALARPITTRIGSPGSLRHTACIRSGLGGAGSLSHPMQSVPLPKEVSA